MWPFKKKEEPVVFPLETRKDPFQLYLRCPQGHMNNPIYWRERGIRSILDVCLECGCDKLEKVSARAVRTVDPNRYWTTIKTEYELAEPC